MFHCHIISYIYRCLYNSWNKRSRDRSSIPSKFQITRAIWNLLVLLFLFFRYLPKLQPLHESCQAPADAAMWYWCAWSIPIYKSIIFLALWNTNNHEANWLLNIMLFLSNEIPCNVGPYQCPHVSVFVAIPPYYPSIFLSLSSCYYYL